MKPTRLPIRALVLALCVLPGMVFADPPFAGSGRDGRHEERGHREARPTGGAERGSGDRRDSRRDDRRVSDRQDSRRDGRDLRDERRPRYREVERDGRSFRHYVAPPPRTVRQLPRRHVVIRHDHRHYYFADGLWYAPFGVGFTLIAPPIGVVVGTLPLGYVTVHIGGDYYYRAYGTYYQHHPRGYVVIEPPVGSEEEELAASTQVIAYPARGQSEARQAEDRYACHRWAFEQSGFDPTRLGGGVPAEQADARRSDYRRAMRACLTGRGYTVE